MNIYVILIFIKIIFDHMKMHSFEGYGLVNFGNVYNGWVIVILKTVSHVQKLPYAIFHLIFPNH